MTKVLEWALRERDLNFEDVLPHLPHGHALIRAYLEIALTLLKECLSVRKARHM